METFGKVAPWVSRALLAPPAVLFLFLGLKYFGNPVGTTAADSILLGSPAAITDMRVIGSLFLACSMITVFLIASQERVLTGLRFVVTVVGTITLARLYGVLADGAHPATMTKLRTEMILLVVFGAALIFETSRQRREERKR